VWSSEPEPCTRSITNPPSWKAYSCQLLLLPHRAVISAVAVITA
jgi:hypothetical protein